ncbi:MAG TPA: hypothetical protein VGN15_14650 [Ktedonobacteraceae bacterium]|nr:hypothetical protein [Ktedonobacteraceae bacterium]
MKFQIGDTTDKALCVALKHEFLRCDDAFNDFASSARIMIAQGENPQIAYKTYNAYARFIHHLYEFMMGAVTRDRQDTRKLESKLADRYTAGHTQRILTNRREAILNGTAPVWENEISYYPERIPQTFAESFRRFRNIISGHVKYERSDLNLLDFYHQNHKYLYLLYYDAKSWWARQSEEFPDLKEITAFAVLVKDDLPLS